MGALDDIKKNVAEAGEKVADAVKDGADRMHDKAKEVRADARVDAAVADRDTTKARNEFNEQLRNAD